MREQRGLGLPWSPRAGRARAARVGGHARGRAPRARARRGDEPRRRHPPRRAATSPAASACSTTSASRCTGCARDGLADRALVVDCDVHQGDGTAQLLGPDPDAFTLSLHGARNYPFQRIPSDLDVDLASGTGDERYLAALDEALDHAIPRARADFAFYLAGADPWEGDRLGRLALTKDGLRARDELVLDRLRAAGMPVCVVLAGGYAEDVRDTVDINAATAAGPRATLPRPTLDGGPGA